MGSWTMVGPPGTQRTRRGCGERGGKGGREVGKSGDVEGGVERRGGRRGRRDRVARDAGDESPPGARPAPGGGLAGGAEPGVIPGKPDYAGTDLFDPAPTRKIP